MKKPIISLIAIAASALGASADYSSLMFVTTAGTKHIVNAEGLEISVADGTLNATSPTVSLQLPAAELASMEFTNDSPTAIAEITAAEAGVTVYTIQGVRMGSFASLDAACSALAKGIYVAHTTDGLTFKMAVK